tara:strand:- start:1002 stop:1343 length:342 start_codon:yes stop_codon:yes gene_type:complete
MIKSANQLYKNSGSNLNFKEWLRREQLKGKLEVHQDKFFNVDGGGNSYLNIDAEGESEMGEKSFEDAYLEKICSSSEEDAKKILKDTKKKIVLYSLVIGVVGGMLISKYVFKK